MVAVIGSSSATRVRIAKQLFASEVPGRGARDCTPLRVAEDADRAEPAHLCATAQFCRQ